LCKATAHDYIESAKRRLAMCTRMQAVIDALGTRQIRLEELLRPCIEPCGTVALDRNMPRHPPPGPSKPHLHSI